MRLLRFLSAFLDGEYMKKTKKAIWITILVICALIAVAGIVFIVYSFSSHQVTRSDFSTTSSSTPDSAPATEETKAAPTEAAAASFGYKLAELGDFDVDFDDLEAINSDIYAWIYVPNTKVDYPVVRSESDGDDTFYLEHNVYRQYQFSGSIFSELINKADMSDPITVFYGHNMLNGSMFATLHDFEDKSFFDENNTMFVITKDKIYAYLIYAAYTYDDRRIVTNRLLNDSKALLEYFESSLNPRSLDANVREGVTLSGDDRVLVLSTCSNNASNTRYIVQGVLAYEQKK